MNSVPDEKQWFQKLSQTMQEQFMFNMVQHESFERFQMYLEWYYDERKWNDRNDY